MFPWSTALSMDLLFWVAIDTLFLSVAKQFTDAQIVLVSTLSLIGGIVLHYPQVDLIKVLGNTTSYRLGTFCYLACAMLVTFSRTFFLVVLGRIFCQLAYTFQSMASVILQNNLELEKRSGEYVRYRTKATAIYSVVTMLISLVADVLFNWNPYAPMICSISLCIISCVLSFFIQDFSPYDRVIQTSAKKASQKCYVFSKYILLILISYSFGSALMGIGQDEGKLFIQQTLLTQFSVEKTAYLISAMVLFSRIVRIISNFAFFYLYKKLRETISIWLNGMLLLALVLMVLGFLLPAALIVRFLVMAIGYALILFLRDAYTTQAQSQMLIASPHEQQQRLISLMGLEKNCQFYHQLQCSGSYPGVPYGMGDRRFSGPYFNRIGNQLLPCAHHPCKCNTAP